MLVPWFSETLLVNLMVPAGFSGETSCKQLDGASGKMAEAGAAKNVLTKHSCIVSLLVFFFVVQGSICEGGRKMNQVEGIP